MKDKMKKTLASVALAAGVLGSVAACGPGDGGQSYSNSTYCVNQAGQVMPDMYCQGGYGGGYELWIGNTYGHSYRPGVVIQHNYFVSGRQVSPSNSAARKAAGLPASGAVKSGVGSLRSSTPAKPQSGPGIGAGGGSTKSYSGSTTRSSTSGGGSKSFSFGGGGGSSRSSGGGFSSGGRK
jgi:hypothetical protein